MIPVQCPQCRSTFGAPEQYAGQNVRCPRCPGIVQVPAFATPVAPAAPTIPLRPPGASASRPGGAPNLTILPSGVPRSTALEPLAILPPGGAPLMVQPLAQPPNALPTATIVSGALPVATPLVAQPVDAAGAAPTAAAGAASAGESFFEFIKSSLANLRAVALLAATGGLILGLILGIYIGRWTKGPRIRGSTSSGHSYQPSYPTAPPGSTALPTAPTSTSVAPGGRRGGGTSGRRPAPASPTSVAAGLDGATDRETDVAAVEAERRREGRATVDEARKLPRALYGSSK